MLRGTLRKLLVMEDMKVDEKGVKQNYLVDGAVWVVATVTGMEDTLRAADSRMKPSIRALLD